MRILLLNSVYREGSTGKIVASLADTLRAQGHEVLTCYGIGSPNIDEYSVKICSNIEHNINALLSRIDGIPYGGLFLSNSRIKNIIHDFNPDVIHVHCINGSMINVYSLLKYFASVRMKTILTLHAEIFHTAGCSHACDCNKWIEGCHDCEYYKDRVYSWFFDRSKSSYKYMYDAVNAFSFDNLIVTAVSPWLAERAQQSAIMKKFRVIYVPNGVDTKVYYQRNHIGLIKKDNYEKTVLFVSPYFGLEELDNKGGRFLPIIARFFPNYRFIVVSSTMANNLPELPSNISLWGAAKNQDELAQLYSEADATLILSKRETFSMVTAESLCCGTPVVGFKAGGPESIALSEWSSFSEYGDIDSLCSSLRDLLVLNINKKEISEKACSTYSSDYCTNMFLSLYKS